MKKIFGVILFTFIVVALVAGVVFLKSNNPPSMQNQNNSVNVSTQNSTMLTAQISPAELAKHDTKDDCWVSYKREVYDITKWLPRHPGGSEAIEPYCGTSEEFEKAFSGQHGTSQEDKLREEGIYKGELTV